ncbi:PEP/pyruvate-binding domain-containing protein [Amycolatopsis sp. EV170708-02-1]|uniref:PEP/pyruvate-binding domain-containing protein n=1 Tax=Amycolatopsis sp. EV170708-02-1 TaxID=2919322 RepID=UPI001F0CC1F0|nr:PEP/pyruvate-binding domain-containing protein [Amycolatopsis sp. EV170708-02-1]UMP06996.1 PEP-utilizing enzyme [Amycolatopsis sp. EV170708-02-1]
MWTRDFTEIGEEDLSLVGGKGLSLAALTRHGIPVPRGFVVTTQAFETLMADNGISPHAPDAGTRVGAAPPPAGLAEEVTKRLNGLNGRYFAVRSSAVSEDSEDRSFAGIFESYLNVPAADVESHVRRCYASLFSDRARHYLHAPEPIAVVIQEMVDSRHAGALFTRHPVDHTEDVIVVESCHGLGELLVSGEITPAHYVLDKRSGVILQRRAGTQHVKLVRVDGQNEVVPVAEIDEPLSAADLRGLSLIARRIETFAGTACDVEWCIDDTGLHIVQSRPITTLREPGDDVSELPKYSKRFSSRILSPIFEEANVQGFHKYARSQFELSFDLSRYHVYQPSFKHPNGDVDIWIDNALDASLIAHMKVLIRRDHNYLERLETRYLRTVEEFTNFCEATEGRDYRQETDELLILLLGEFDELNQRMTSIYNAPIFALTPLAELVSEEMQGGKSANFSDDFATLTFSDVPNSAFLQEEEFLRILLVTQERLGHAAWSDEVLEDAEISALIDQYHRRWRFLACTDVIGEAFTRQYFEDLLRSRFPEDAAQLWRIMLERQEAERDAVRAAMRVYPWLQYEITWLRTWTYHRNHTTEHYYRDFQCLKPLLVEVACRLGTSYRLLLNLSVSEIAGALAGTAADARSRAVHRGRKGFSLEWRQEAPFLATGVRRKDRLEVIRERTEDRIEGQVANRGAATGTVRIVKDPVLESSRFETGDILVTPMTTPSFVPLMARAAAIVTDEGGVLCHAAIVSRELNKPCVIAAHNATQLLTEGMRVHVDADRGEVLVLAPLQGQPA